MLEDYTSYQTIITQPAQKSDQAMILGTTDVDQHTLRFLVAEVNEQVGIGQIKRHLDGSCELASLVVQMPYRQRGIGSLLVTALIKEHLGTIFLIYPQFMERY
jgi:N-acetylglutamate synthase-like GNAT family acetyltransferase